MLDCMSVISGQEFKNLILSNTLESFGIDNKQNKSSLSTTNILQELIAPSVSKERLMMCHKYISIHFLGPHHQCLSQKICSHQLSKSLFLDLMTYFPLNQSKNLPLTVFAGS